MTANLSKIAAMRDKITQLQTRIEQLDDGGVPVPLAEALAAADDYVDTLVAAGRHHFALGVGQMIYPDAERSPALVRNTTDDIGRNLVSFVAMLDSKRLREHFHAVMREQYATLPAPMTSEQQRIAVLELRDELRALEKSEYAATELARKDGAPIEHRPDVDPAVLLGIA